MTELDKKLDPNTDQLLGLIVDELPSELAKIFIKRYEKTKLDIFSKNQYLIRPDLGKKRPAADKSVKAEKRKKTEDNACFRCKQPGHWSTNCPLNQKKKVDIEETGATSQISKCEKKEPAVKDLSNTTLMDLARPSSK